MMVAELQERILDILIAKKTAADEAVPATYSPKKIAAYDGELNKLNQVRTLPAVYVDVPGEFEIEAMGSGGSLYNGDFNPDIVIFENNKASGSDKAHDLAVAVDWVIKSLKDEVIMINDAPLELSRRIRAQLFTDIEPASAILTLVLQNLD